MFQNSDNILITGAEGNLGKELIKVLEGAAGVGRKDFDITNCGEVLKFIKTAKPAIVIHLAAIADVIKCEREKELAWRTNVLGTENIVDALQDAAPDAYFIYISTACVFRGDKGNYAENDFPDPINFYGLTKLIGEFVAKRMKNHLVVRTNFAPRAPWKHKRAFSDRWGTYLFADDLARAMKEVIGQNLRGVVHVCGDKKMSMFELAQIVSPGVKPFTLAEFAKTSDVHLTQDMTLKTSRINAYKITF